MSAWITDRVPTREDGDCMTMVWVSSPREVYRCAYSVVKLGTPWQPITYPEPYVKPKVWTLEIANCEHNVRKNGILVWTFFPKHWTSSGMFTVAHLQAMTDALNRLEEGV